MWHIQDKHVKDNQRENADKTNKKTDKVKEHAACNMEVDHQLSINGLSTAIYEKKNITITKKLSDPKVGTHHQIFVEEQNQEKLLVSNKIECFKNLNKNISEKKFFYGEPGPSNTLPNSENCMSESQNPQTELTNDKLLNISERSQIQELKADQHQRIVKKLRNHIGHHVDKNNFKCIKCNQKFASHLCKIHAMELRNYRTMYRNFLKLNHKNLKHFKCDICNKRIKQISKLKNQTVIHTEKSIAELPSCDICHKMFSDSQNLMKHIKESHSKSKPYICKICGHQSARKIMIQLHVQQHKIYSKSKYYNCQMCGYQSASKTMIKLHVRQHTGEKHFNCNNEPPWSPPSPFLDEEESPW